MFFHVDVLEAKYYLRYDEVPYKSTGNNCLRLLGLQKK